MKRSGRTIRQDKPKPVHLSLEGINHLPIVLLRQEALDEIRRHASSEMMCEVGGYLAGFPVIDMDSNLSATYIEKAIPGLYQSTSAHFVMLPQSLNAVDAICEKTGLLLVGYYHSHPGHGVFQSGLDEKNFRDLYYDSYKIAVVIDPHRIGKPEIDPTWIGFFGWDTNGHPIRLSAKNIVVITQQPEIASGKKAEALLEAVKGKSAVNIPSLGNVPDVRRSYTLDNIGRPALHRTLAIVKGVVVTAQKVLMRLYKGSFRKLTGQPIRRVKPERLTKAILMADSRREIWRDIKGRK